jgi:anti-anti-sigma factor
MERTVEKAEARTLSLCKQLDTLTAVDFEKEIRAVLQSEATDVALDGSALTYISSAGLRLLLTLQKGMKAKGGKLRLVNIRPEIMEIFNITGFSSILTIEYRPPLMVKTLHITNDMEQLSLLHKFMEESLPDIRPDSALFMNLKLAMEEAVVNIILYAYPGEKDKEITVCLKRAANRLTVVITDCGLAFDPTAKKEPDLSLPLDERPVGGLGTFLLKRLMTNVSYLRAGNKNILTMIKELD